MNAITRNWLFCMFSTMYVVISGLSIQLKQPDFHDLVMLPEFVPLQIPVFSNFISFFIALAGMKSFWRFSIISSGWTCTTIFSLIFSSKVNSHKCWKAPSLLTFDGNWTITLSLCNWHLSKIIILCFSCSYYSLCSSNLVINLKLFLYCFMTNCIAPWLIHIAL